MNVLRSNNKPASEAVLLSKKQAENVQRLKKETKAYLREYTDLIKINKDGETKESAQSFVSQQHTLTKQSKPIPLICNYR